MKTIAVIAYSLTIEYSLTVINGIRKYFSGKNDVNLIVIPVKVPHSTLSDYDYQHWTAVEILKSKSIDAVIVVTNPFLNFLTVEELSKYLEFLAPKPVISVATPLNLPSNKYTSVSSENAYKQIVEHLIKKHNKKKIAFFSACASNSPDAEDRFISYKKALAEFNLPYDENLVYPGDFTPKTCYEYLKSHFKSREEIPFDALLCANDYMAGGCESALHELDVLIPEDVCVFGFDDTEVAMNYRPTISTVNQQIELTGEKAAEVAYRVLDGEDVPDKTVIDCFPVYRQSCGCVEKNLLVNGYVNQDGKFVESFNLTTQLNIFGNGLNDMDTISNHLDISDSITNINNFFENLKRTLTKLHIPLFSICVYDEPVSLDYKDDFVLPEKAKLLIRIDNENEHFCNFFDAGGVEFSTKDSLLPMDVVVPASGIFYMIPIFLRKFNYGYLLAKLPTEKFPLYVLYFKILANAFVHSYEISKNEKEHALLIERNQNLNFEAKTDELTKLFNRRGFLEYGQQLLDVSNISEKEGAVFFCDLDGLKTINDTWGHEIGDLAIKTEAKVLRTAFRDSDMIGRLSGDEFGVVAPGLPVEKIKTIRARLKAINEEYSKEAGLPFTLSISVGAIAFNKDLNDLRKLLNMADEHLYKEKKLKHPERNK